MSPTRDTEPAARLTPADALQRSEERLRLAMEATELGTFEWDIPEDRVACSPNVETLFGLPSDRGLRLSDIIDRIHPEDQPDVRETIRVAMDVKGPRTYAGEFRTVPVAGRIRWIDARGAVLFSRGSGHPQCMVGIVLDITGRKMREQQLEQEAIDLSSANRLKDEFMATLAHELRNPLTPIRNGIEILELTGLSHPSQQHACHVMERQLRHLVHLVDDLLDVSRIRQRKLRLNPEIVSVRRLVDMAVETILPRIEAAQQRLAVDLPQTPLLVEADPVRLSQAIGNLLANSTRYTPAGGSIQLLARPSGNDALLEIRDTGIGIDPAVLPHVFEMFRQGAAAGPRREAGLGIGLALTKALVEMHHGRITAESAGHNRGSTFRVWLPIVNPAAAESVNRPPERTTASTERRRVLVVDDDPDAADSTAALLGLLGHEVHQARDGKRAVRAAEQFEPDIVLMDLGMPGMDGHEAARNIRALPLKRRPLIVALTGWSQDSERLKSRLSGIDAYLLKPVEAHAISEIIARLDTQTSVRTD